MKVPDQIRLELRQRLWAEADAVGWTNLSPGQKSQHYENWTRQHEVGGLLSRFMDRGKVRVYIKDTLLKDYSARCLADDSRPLRVLGLESCRVEASYVKPHGRKLSDGRIVCWGRAEDWKIVLMALHERAYADSSHEPYAAVLLAADARYGDHAVRQMIQAAAHLLGIKKVVWLD